MLTASLGTECGPNTAMDLYALPLDPVGAEEVVEILEEFPRHRHALILVLLYDFLEQNISVAISDHKSISTLRRMISKSFLVMNSSLVKCIGRFLGSI